MKTMSCVSVLVVCFLTTAAHAAPDPGPAPERPLLEIGEAAMIGAAGALLGAAAGLPTAYAATAVVIVSPLAFDAPGSVAPPFFEEAWGVAMVVTPVMVIALNVLGASATALGIAAVWRGVDPEATCPVFVCGPFGRE